MLANNPAYQVVFEHADFKLYGPVNIATGFHESRYVELVNQQIYSDSGANREVLETLAKEMLVICNKELKMDTVRTDIGLLANNILFRLKHPVDQHCAIRMGALMCFMEPTTGPCENPDTVDHFWQSRKEDLAMQIPDLYAFFLTMGVQGTPKYNELWSTLDDEDYFLKRDQALRMLLPNLPKEESESLKAPRPE